MSANEPDGADRLRKLIAGDPWRLRCLAALKDLALPDAWIGAGFARSLVWDHLHGYAAPTPLGDVDVLYFDRDDLTKESEAANERRLEQRMADVPWSVKNQARMHVRNGDSPYGSTAEALKYWLETPTAVAVALDADDHLQLIAPFGLDDLFAMTVRPTPKGLERLDEFRARVASKGWFEAWPQAKLVL